MTMTPMEIDHGATATYSQLFRALADPNRLAILQHLSGGEHRVRDLVEHLGFAQSTVSVHLQCLRECGLVTVRAEGRASWYALACADELSALLDGARRVLDSTGSQVELCSQLMGK